MLPTHQTKIDEKTKVNEKTNSNNIISFTFVYVGPPSSGGNDKLAP